MERLGHSVPEKREERPGAAKSPIEGMKAAGTSASELGGGGEECSPLQGMLQLYFGWLWAAGLAAPRTADRAADSPQAAGPLSHPTL